MVATIRGVSHVWSLLGALHWQAQTLCTARAGYTAGIQQKSNHRHFTPINYSVKQVPPAVLETVRLSAMLQWLPLASGLLFFN